MFVEQKYTIRRYYYKIALINIADISLKIIKIIRMCFLVR